MMITCSFFDGLFDSGEVSIGVWPFLLCLGVALLLGLVIAFFQMLQEKNSRSLIITLALMPSIVAMIIMMVNGSIGTGIAIAGAFSLVRFRSHSGTAKELCAIFIGMTAGLAIGMGYLGFATVFVLVVSPFQLLLSTSRFAKMNVGKKTLRITVPEDLDYENAFEDLFTKYLTGHRLVSSRTTNMGSMFRLNYEVSLKHDVVEKEFIDDLRCRNGNLEVSISIAVNESEL